MVFIADGEAGGGGSDGTEAESPIIFGVIPEKINIISIGMDWECHYLQPKASASAVNRPKANSCDGTTCSIPSNTS